MARDPSFPRTRHVALSFSERPEEAKAEGAEAILLPIRSAEGQPRQGTPLPRPEKAGAPGVPAKGDLPAAAAEDGVSAGVHTAAPPPRELPAVVLADVSEPAGDDACRAFDGAAAPVRCASSLEGREAAGALAARAAGLGEAVLLSGLERWYALGPLGDGYCRSCELKLGEQLRESYGDNFEPFEVLPLLKDAALPVAERPFARVKEALRLTEAVAFGKRAVLRARDEARAKRSLEIAVLGQVRAVDPVSLLLCAHLDGLLFSLPSFDPDDALLPLQAARAALGARPAVVLLPREATASQTRLFSALATACDCDIVLEDGASAEARAALFAHRKFLAVVRERFRPSSPLPDAELLFSPSCDHWTAGAHQKSASACMAGLARAQLQPAVRLDLDGGVHAPLLVLAGASALSLADAAAAKRFVEGGGDALIIGRCAVSDDEGRLGELVFPSVKSGLERVGEGRVYALDESATLLPRALRELGRRPQLSIAGRGRVLLRAYVDAERKLDVHLVNLDLREAGVLAAQGVQLTVAGSAAGGGRIGYWFAQEREGGRDGERITLNPSGFSVSTILPSVEAYALLAVPR
jgi:hypothetical protein